MIYIASPFTHPDPLVMKHRRDAVFLYAAELTRRGVLCFSPIVYGYPFFAEYDFPPAFGHWQMLNDHLIGASNGVHVLQLKGWEASLGVSHEIARATRLGLPIEYIQP